MPNYVKNVWRIKNINPANMQYLINKLTTIQEGTLRMIDFNLIAPEPQFKQDCPSRYRVSDPTQAHIQEDKDRPWFNWYDWHLRYWGTKWNAFDGYILERKTQLTLVFNTAWSMPEIVLKTMYEDICLPRDLEVDVKWADEDIGENCGHIILHEGEDYDDRFIESSSWGLSNPEQFAKYLWRNY